MLFSGGHGSFSRFPLHGTAPTRGTGTLWCTSGFRRISETNALGPKVDQAGSFSGGCVPPRRAAKDHGNPQLYCFLSLFCSNCCIMTPSKLFTWGSHGTTAEALRALPFVTDTTGASACVSGCERVCHPRKSRVTRGPSRAGHSVSLWEYRECLADGRETTFSMHFKNTTLLTLVVVTWYCCSTKGSRHLYPS